MLNIDSSKLKQIIKDKYKLSDSDAEKQALNIIETTDRRLEENLLQWMNSEPISDLWIGKYCINAIMSIRKDSDFISALEAMNLYLSDETAGVQKIWRTKK